LKKAKASDIQQVRQQVKAKMEQLLDQELRKPNSDLVFDLGLKTKEQFVQQLAAELEIDLKNKKCSQAEKDLVNQMAEQMVATVKEKFPNKAGAGKMKFTNKFKEESDAPTEFQLGNTKYTNPKYLSSGGLGDVLRYEEKDSDPKKYMVLKSLKKADKRDDMVRELKMHRQANGGETGTGSPNVVDMKGAIQGQNGELFMAVDYAEGGDLKDLGTGMTQAMQTGALSEEARQVLTQHLLRQAVLGMKQVQDSNMTHHDIKGQNFLIGGDGKVKVADFGSAQVADDQGEVPSDNFEFTAGFQAPDLRNDRITGKADTYTLGVMLNNLSSPIQGEDAIASKWTSDWEFKSKQGVTALDKLKNGMLSKKPEERPTLEAVMQTSYMTDSSANYEPEKIDNLMKATMDYNKNVAGKTRDDMERILRLQGLIVHANKQKQGATPEDAANLDQEIAKHSDEIKQCRAKIDKVLAQDDVKPYVAALQKANNELTGRGAEGEKLDVSKLKFKEEYEKIAQTYRLSPNNRLVQTLIQALTAVDQAGDAVTKKKLAEKAQQEAGKVAKQMTEIAKSASEETKLQASRLGTDLRKLEQALEKAAAA
jgi:serine/threonine protein kinase/uncharacterized protein YnzC (UPF0291/DUF896 family)